MAFGLDDIEDFIGDVSDAAGDLVDAAASLFDGPGGVAGIFVSGATLFVGGPTALVPAIIAGVATTEGVNALIKTRRLSEYPEESLLAEMVFGNSLPSHDKIILTNLIGLEGRAFTIPNPAGECLVNLGDDFERPVRSASYPEYGQLLIHELTHAWQIHHSTFVPGLICEGVLNQSRYTLGEDVYNPGDGGESWSGYNLEQQATITDLWYGGYLLEGRISRRVVSDGVEIGGCSTEHPFYRHVVEINGGTPPPVVQALSVRTVARRKFATQGGFSVGTRFPRLSTVAGVPRSLRRSLIGLRKQ